MQKSRNYNRDVETRRNAEIRIEMQKRDEIRDAEMIRLKTFNKNHSI